MTRAYRPLLDRADLVRRGRDHHDRSVTHVELTHAGASLKRSASAIAMGLGRFLPVSIASKGEGA